MSPSPFFSSADGAEADGVPPKLNNGAALAGGGACACAGAAAAGAARGLPFLPSPSTGGLAAGVAQAAVEAFVPSGSAVAFFAFLGGGVDVSRSAQIRSSNFV